MKKTSSMLTTLAAFVFTIAFAAAAQASVPRTFVSSTGSDTNTATSCGPTAPCRNFAAAYSVTNNKGEIVALDTAGYGQLTINSSVTITAATTAFITVASSQTGITVNAGATDVVLLRNISITGAGNTSTTGIAHNSGRLIIHNGLFTHLATGLSVVNARADVIDCTFTDNGTGIVCDGTGNDGPGNGPFIGAAQVRINAGNITFNAVGLQQNNAGLNGQNNPRLNIWIFALGQNATLNLAGNTTSVACTGTLCQPQPAIYNTFTDLH